MGVSLENFQALALVVSSAFGGRKSKPKPVESIEEAVERLNAVFGTKSGISAVTTDNKVFEGLEEVLDK